MEPDEVWVARALESPEAFEELVRRYQRRIFAYVLRHTNNRDNAEDLVQETFLRAFRSLRTFREGAAFGPWIYKIAVNVCISAHQAQKPVESIEDEAETFRSALGNPEHDTLQRQSEEAVATALNNLPADYRQAMLLRHINGLSYQEIAEVMQVPLGTVKTWLFRGREQLLATLQREGAL
jgi:RNA polymerase sigma-70 factor (ECF subfamily)